jgi:predicted unusual protein kinase regulating ubiquinone biosynthesis (AarF/ABC1/UbiB family)
LAKLGAMTSRVAASYVQEGVRQVLGTRTAATTAAAHVRNAADMARQLAQLKGAAMKMGQQLALFADALDLPPEVRETLGALNNRATAVPFERIRATVERELAGPLSDHFAWFDERPLGTASLAQAHAAKDHAGRDVVVKVLHDGVAEGMRTDVAAFRAMLYPQLLAFGRKKSEIDEVFSEIEARLAEELDYVQEAYNLAEYARVWRDDVDLSVPGVDIDRSTRRVLIMGRVSGVDIDTFASMASEASKARAAAALSRFTFGQLTRQRAVHADPHPGNFLFTADGAVGVLDFGCIKRFDPYFLETWSGVAWDVLDDRRDAALRGCVDLGAWDGADPAAGDALWHFLSTIGVAFRQGPVVLGGPQDTMLETLRAPALGLLRFGSIRAPRDVIFLHRALGGLYMLGRQLGIRVDFAETLRTSLPR